MSWSAHGPDCTGSRRSEDCEPVDDEANAKDRGELCDDGTDPSRQRDEATVRLRGYYRAFRDDLCELFELIASFSVDNSLITSTVPEHLSNDDDEDVQSEQPREVNQTHKTLLRRLEMHRNERCEAEHQLYFRHESFAREERERVQKCTADQDVETEEEMHFRDLFDTHEITRRIIRAEEGHMRVRQEAIAGGMQNPASDLESGFIDDTDDGYRLSFESDMIAAVDKGWVHSWLEEIPDDLVETLPPAKVEVGGDIHAATPSEMREVETWESASQLALGRYRRKIDQWAGKTAILTGS